MKELRIEEFQYVGQSGFLETGYVVNGIQFFEYLEVLNYVRSLYKNDKEENKWL